ncbi:MAG: VWA domain-containing protein [Vallitaleaceae bacterium]|jgi:Ca-activated chloride channel family protein|nr:VWA domain-containing protein [Vallitaleaceae bacterium]
MKKSIFVMLVTLIMVVGMIGGCSKSDDYTDSKRDDAGTTDVSDNTDAPAGESSVEEQPQADMAYDTTEADTAYESTDDVYNEPISIEGETYQEIVENTFTTTGAESVSTFSIDVDTAAYANIRNMINYGVTPSADAVRIEEMINYFDYEYITPSTEDVFSINTAIAECPWNEDNQLLMIGMQGYDLPIYALPDNNIVFLLDVSGSMSDANKLPLLIDAFEILAEQFDEDDRVSIVVYAGASGVVLNGVRGNHHDVIIEALNDLRAGGSTAGSEGIQLAYQLAEENFIRNGNNRVILATDGDFNVGITNQSDLEDYIADKRDSDIFLSVLGFGRGNYNDEIAETLADKGNGNYSYIDTISEAEKVFSEEFAGTMYAIAKDVKLQIEFNDSVVYAYKLVGYENRVMANEDFNDDTKDAGELGLGHTVTALYEVILKETVRLQSTELFCTIDIRYKEPDEDESKLLRYAVTSDDYYSRITDNTNLLWAASVANFGMILRNETYIDYTAVGDLIETLETYFGMTADPYRQEFIQLLKQYKGLI